MLLYVFQYKANLRTFLLKTNYKALFKYNDELNYIELCNEEIIFSIFTYKC